MAQTITNGANTSPVRSLLFALVAVLHLSFGGQAAVRTFSDTDIELIVSLLSRRCCPAGVMQLMQLGVCGQPVVAGLALQLACTPLGNVASPQLQAALAVHAACGLGTCTSARTVPMAVHGLTLAACTPAVLRPVMLRKKSGARLSGPTMPRPKVRLAGAGATALGATVILMPSVAVGAALHCAGQTLELPSSAMRAAGATFLCLGLSTSVVCGQCRQDRQLRYMVASVLLSSFSVGLSALKGAHAFALRRWARAALVTVCGSCAASALGCRR